MAPPSEKAKTEGTEIKKIAGRTSTQLPKPLQIFARFAGENRAENVN
jgi:hypothetical protein